MVGIAHPPIWFGTKYKLNNGVDLRFDLYKNLVDFANVTHLKNSDLWVSVVVTR